MDYCSFWIDRLFIWDWSHCCAAHDEAYAIGVIKQVADYFMRACVNGELPGMGHVMAAGVATIFGWIAYRRAAEKRKARA